MRFGRSRLVCLLLIPGLSNPDIVWIDAKNLGGLAKSGAGADLGASIVGKWRMSGAENQTVWEFSSHGPVRVGEITGRYKLGDQDRIKIETPFATTVYLVTLSSDQLVLQEPNGSKLEFTRMQ